VVYVLIEAQENGVLWRSDDRGLHWNVVNSERRINTRPFYYTQVRVDPNHIYFNGHFGDITWIDMRNSEERYIQPYPVGPSGEGADAELYRFNWNSPIHMSPSDPDVEPDQAESAAPGRRHPGGALIEVQSPVTSRCATAAECSSDQTPSTSFGRTSSN